MNLHVLFLQRRERYDGELAPEAIAIADEYTLEEVPEYLDVERQKYERDVGSEAIESFAEVVIEVPHAEILQRLRPKSLPIKGAVQ